MISEISCSPGRWSLILSLSSFFQVTICVSGYSTGSAQIEEEFGVSAEVGTAGLTLFIVSLPFLACLFLPLLLYLSKANDYDSSLSLSKLGFAIGPMLLAPLSEFFGELSRPRSCGSELTRYTHFD